MQTLMTLEDVKRELRAGEYAFPGGYHKVFVTTEGEYLCYRCVRANFREVADAMKSNDTSGGWCVSAADVYWEGPSMACANCNAPIESEYGDPDDE